MNDMNERNKLLAEAFGECWHKLSFNEDQIVCSCGAHYNGEGYHDRAYNHVHGINPDYFTLVTLKCDKCNEKGMICTDCVSITVGSINLCTDCERKDKPEFQCPCQGNPRIISKLQHEIEKRGEWDEFETWLAEKYILNRSLKDLIKLCDAYLEFRKEAS